MLTKQKLRRDWRVVHVVAERDGRRSGVRIKLKQAGQQSAIDSVGDGQHQSAWQQDKQKTHGDPIFGEDGKIQPF